LNIVNPRSGAHESRLRKSLMERSSFSLYWEIFLDIVKIYRLRSFSVPRI
jgi:hypothetical protein